MDLNHLIHREGEERLRAERAGSAEARAAHDALADLFRGRLDRRRRLAGRPSGAAGAVRPDGR